MKLNLNFNVVSLEISLFTNIKIASKSIQSTAMQLLHASSFRMNLLNSIEKSNFDFTKNWNCEFRTVKIKERINYRIFQQDYKMSAFKVKADETFFSWTRVYYGNFYWEKKETIQKVNKR